MVLPELASTATIRVLWVFGERAVREPLLVAQLDAAEIKHPILHGDQHFLAVPSGVALEQRSDDTERKMQASPGIADLRACD